MHGLGLYTEHIFRHRIPEGDWLYLSPLEHCQKRQAQIFFPTIKTHEIILSFIHIYSLTFSLLYKKTIFVYVRRCLHCGCDPVSTEGILSYVILCWLWTGRFTNVVMQIFCVFLQLWECDFCFALGSAI